MYVLLGMALLSAATLLLQVALRKAKRLTEAGWRVIRIREQPLEPITELDVRVPLGSSPKSIVDLLIPRLVELGLVPTADAGAYLSRSDLAAGERSLEAVRAIQAQRQKEPVPAT